MALTFRVHRATSQDVDVLRRLVSEADVVVDATTPNAGTPVTGIATDNSGNSTTSDPFVVKVDKTGPAITASAKKADGGDYTAGTWTNQTFNTTGTLTLTITGGTSKLGFQAAITGNTFDQIGASICRIGRAVVVDARQLGVLNSGTDGLQRSVHLS